jgi:hypothetical protein
MTGDVINRRVSLIYSRGGRDFKFEEDVPDEEDDAEKGGDETFGD